MCPLHHIRLNVLKLFSEVKITFNIRRKVSNIEPARDLMDVNRLPERQRNNENNSIYYEIHKQIKLKQSKFQLSIFITLHV